MNQQEFLQLLESSRVVDWLTALRSGYKVRSEEEILAIAQVAQTLQPEVQEAALGAVADTDARTAVAVLSQLARNAREPSVRRSAIERLCLGKTATVNDILLTCARDQHPGPQEAAIRCMGGKSDPRMRTLLLERLEQPDVDLSGTGEAERIRKASLSALAARPDASLTEVFVSAALRFPQHRNEAFQGLQAIEQVSVANALVDIILDGAPEGLPDPDGAFQEQALGVIASKPPRRGQPLKRYREVLCRLYRSTVSPHLNIPDVLGNEVRRIFNDAIGDCLLEHLAQTSGEIEVTNTVQQISSILTEVSFADALPYWMALLDVHPDQARQHLVGELVSASADHVDLLATTVVDNIRQKPNAMRHQDNRLPLVVRSLGPMMAEAITPKLLPLFGDEDAHIWGLSAQYLKHCRDVSIEKETWTAWLRYVLEHYSNTSKSRDGLGSFIETHLRDQLSREQRFPMWGELLDSGLSADIQLLGRLVSTSSSPQGVLTEVLEAAVQKRGRWGPARQVLDVSPEEVRGHVLAHRLQVSWHDHMMTYLVNDNAHEATVVCRHILGTDEYDISPKAKVKVISYFANLGNQDDVNRLLDELSSIEPQIRAAAAEALGILGNTMAEGALGLALEDDYNVVVQAAIRSLQLIAEPTVDTVRLLQERVAEDPDEQTRQLAVEALSTLVNRHLSREPLSDTVGWLTTLEAFGRCGCGEQLEGLLYSLEGDAELRARVATTIGVCCEPESGLGIIERRLSQEPVERNREVRQALEAAVFELRGSPDMALLKLLDEVVSVEFDREALLGSYSFEELFAIENTVALLRDYLPKVLDDQYNPDAFITRLDGVADILCNEVEDALVRRFPNTATQGGRRGYSSQIEFMGRASAELRRAARGLHELRHKSDLAHVVDETSGQPKEGCDEQDQADARRHFQVIVSQVIAYLGQDYEAHGKPSE